MMVDPAEQTGMDRSEALALAERYAARGIPSFPIAISWDDTKQKTSKKPINANGHLGASTDQKRIRQMFNGATLPAGAAIGVGLHLGPAGMFILDGDLDGRGDGVAELAAVFAEHGIFETVRTLTPSGGVHAWLGKGTYHVYNGSPFNAIDVRGDDGWVVAPGVVTPWGEWSFDPEGDLWDGCYVADAPETLLAHIGATDGPRATRQTAAGNRAMPDDLDPRDRAALEALIELGGNYSHRDATSIHVTRPGKIAGTSATIGHIGPGVVKVFTSSWPPLKADRRYDADEVIALALGGTAEGAPDATPPDQFGVLNLLDWPTFWQNQAVGADWLMEPLIARGRSHAFYAGAKSGKSLLMLAACAAIATGRPFLNNPARPPQHILYLDYEMTEEDVRERLEGFGYGPEDDLTCFHYALLPSVAPLDSEMGAATVVAAATAFGAVHVVIDTMSRAVAGDENEAQTVRDFYRFTGLHLKARGIGYHRLDHSGKDITKGQRGTSAKNDDVDVVQQLIPRDQGVTVKATHRRMSWVPEVVDIAVEEDDGSMTYTTKQTVHPTGTFHVVDWLDANDIPVEMSRRAVRDLLKEAGFAARNDALTAALKVRRGRAADLVSGLGPRSGPHFSTPQEPPAGTTGTETQNRRSGHGDHVGDHRGPGSSAYVGVSVSIDTDHTRPASETTPRRTAAELLAGTKLEGLM